MSLDPRCCGFLDECHYGVLERFHLSSAADQCTVVKLVDALHKTRLRTTQLLNPEWGKRLSNTQAGPDGLEP